MIGSGLGLVGVDVSALDAVAPRRDKTVVAKSTDADVYISTGLEEQINALNREALLIDGDPAENVVPMVSKTGVKTGPAIQAARAR